jgi:hypothetical protein
MISIQTLRSWVDVTKENEVLVRSTLASVLQQFYKGTNKVWEAATDKEFLIQPSNEWQAYLFIGMEAMSGVTSVQERDLPSDAWTDLVEDTDYTVLGSSIENLRDESWGRYVRVLASGGYAEDACPDDVKEAIGLEVLRIINRNNKDRIAIDSQLLTDNGTTKFNPIGERHPAFVRVIHRMRSRAFN